MIQSLLIVVFMYIISNVFINEVEGLSAPSLADTDPKYKIRITEHAKLVPELINSKSILMNLEDDIHRCYLPIKKDKGDKQEPPKETPQERLERIKTSIVENIFSKFLTSCYFRFAGWWIYEFCFGRHVRQFHQEQHQVTAEFFLGHSKEIQPVTKYLKYYDVHINEQSPEESYISMPFEKGTPCDLTKQPRTSEVRIYCATDLKRRQLTTGNTDSYANFVGDIEEPSTCNYLVKFYSNLLCQIEGFSPKKETESDTIYCVPETITTGEEEGVDIFGDDLILEELPVEDSVQPIPVEQAPTDKTTTDEEQGTKQKEEDKQEENVPLENIQQSIVL